MLDGSHYSALFAGYAAAMAGAIAARKFFPRAWPGYAGESFRHPWREFGYALIAVVGVILMGQLYQRGVRFPTDGSWRTFAEIANQILIFSPMVLLLIVRRHTPETAWLPRRNVVVHIATGIVLACVAVIVFMTVRHGISFMFAGLSQVARPSNADKLVQVFLEDFAIAILMVRLGAALRLRVLAALVVAFLFAAGHVPAMLTQGAALGELGMLGADFVLGAIVLLTVQRTASIWWFVWIHFAMDMMQFVRATG